jgi:hypothetical protein
MGPKLQELDVALSALNASREQQAMGGNFHGENDVSSKMKR